MGGGQTLEMYMGESEGSSTSASFFIGSGWIWDGLIQFYFGPPFTASFEANQDGSIFSAD